MLDSGDRFAEPESTLRDRAGTALVVALVLSLLAGTAAAWTATGATAGPRTEASGGPDSPPTGETRSTGTDHVWETNTGSNGTAEVVEGGLTGAKLNLSVYKCSYAFANASLGEVDGTLSIAFDWRTYSDGYWELSKVIVRVDGEERFLQNRSGVRIRHSVNETETGRVNATVPVDGNVTVAVGIIPSQYCTNGDHADTTFTVSDLTIETDEATPTPTPTPASTATTTPSPTATPTATPDPTPTAASTATVGGDAATAVDRGTVTATAGETSTIQVDASAGDVTLDSVTVRANRSLSGAVNVTASVDPLPTSPDFEISPDHEALAYFSVESTAAEASIQRVRFRVRIARAAVDSAGGPGDIALYRYGDGRWVAQPTSLVAERADAYVFAVTADGFSEWVAGTERPDMEVARANVDVGASGEGGERARIEARITNEGAAAGVYVTRLLLDGEPVERRRVTVPSGGTVEVGFERAFQAAGTYTVEVNNVTAGTVAVAEEGALTVRESGAVVTARTTTASGSGPLFGGAGRAALAALAAVAVVGWRLREG